MKGAWYQPMVSSGLAGQRLGGRVLCFETLESTNDRALELLGAGEPEGALILTEQQTRGRGRRDRVWESPHGMGIYASLVLRPRLPSRLLPLVSLSFAVGIATALRRAGFPRVALKWPNDLLLGERKLAGILAEARGDGMEGGLVVGLGLNVNQQASDFPVPLRETAISLRMASGQSWDRFEILKALLLRCEEEYDELQENGPGALLRRFEAHSAFTRGCQLEVDLGMRVAGGRFAGLGSSGELLLETGGAEPEAFQFGEVRRVTRG